MRQVHQAPRMARCTAPPSLAAALLFSFFFSVYAVAAPYPAEHQFRSAIAEAARLLKSEGFEIDILDAQKEGVRFPLMAAGLSLTDGVCLIFYNTRPEAALSRFFDSIEETDLPIWLTAFAVHEFAHCAEQREAYVRKRFDRVLPPMLARDDLTLQGYLSVVRSGGVEGWGEALADIASVLYFRHAAPERWRQFAHRLAAMRRDLASRWPAHDTSAWLRRMIADDVDAIADQSLFETAFRLRRLYRPEHTPAGHDHARD